jgi:hypothetical protein
VRLRSAVWFRVTSGFRDADSGCMSRAGRKSKLEAWCI